jgi:hypothetical protein
MGAFDGDAGIRPSVHQFANAAPGCRFQTMSLPRSDAKAGGAPTAAAEVYYRVRSAIPAVRKILLLGPSHEVDESGDSGEGCRG